MTSFEDRLKQSIGSAKPQVQPWYDNMLAMNSMAKHDLREQQLGLHGGLQQITDVVSSGNTITIGNGVGSISISNSPSTNVVLYGAEKPKNKKLLLLGVK